MYRNYGIGDEHQGMDDMEPAEELHPVAFIIGWLLSTVAVFGTIALVIYLIAINMQ